MPADTFKYHEELLQADGLHNPKYHAALHALGAVDELNLAVMAFNPAISSEIKTYIDSQIAGENHWDLDSGNVLVPYITGASIDLGSGAFTTTGLGTFGTLAAEEVTCTTLNYTTLNPAIDSGEWDYNSGNATLTPKEDDVNVDIEEGYSIAKRFYLNENAYIMFNSGNNSIDFIIV